MRQLCSQCCWEGLGAGSAPGVRGAPEGSRLGLGSEQGEMGSEAKEEHGAGGASEATWAAPLLCVFLLSPHLSASCCPSFGCSVWLKVTITAL